MCRAGSPYWRAAVAWGALKELDPSDAAVIAAEFMPLDGAGSPFPTFFQVMTEAEVWADMASPAERDAYALACARRMTPARLGQLIDRLIIERNAHDR